MEASAGEYIKNYLHLKRFHRISLHCKSAPIQYWEYEGGLLRSRERAVLMQTDLRFLRKAVDLETPNCAPHRIQQRQTGITSSVSVRASSQSTCIRDGFVSRSFTRIVTIFQPCEWKTPNNTHPTPEKYQANNKTNDNHDTKLPVGFKCKSYHTLLFLAYETYQYSNALCNLR